MPQGYKAQFFDKLIKNLQQLPGQMTIDENDKLIKSVKNTCLFAKALHKTFNDMGDVAGMMAMTWACDYTSITQ